MLKGLLRPDTFGRVHRQHLVDQILGFWCHSVPLGGGVLEKWERRTLNSSLFYHILRCILELILVYAGHTSVRHTNYSYVDFNQLSLGASCYTAKCSHFRFKDTEDTSIWWFVWRAKMNFEVQHSLFSVDTEYSNILHQHDTNCNEKWSGRLVRVP